MKERYLTYILILPSVAVLAFVSLFPFIMNIYYSLFSIRFNVPGEPSFVGVGNFADLFMDPVFYNGVVLTFTFLSASLIIEMLLGLGVALLLAKELRGARIFRTLIMLPIVMTPAVVGMTWRALFNPSFSIINYFAQYLGLYSKWTADPRTVMPSLILVDIWQWTPFVALILLAGLQALPREPFEAAQIDGASSLRSFLHITLPLLSPIIMIAALFRLIDLVKTFDMIFVITRGGPGYSSETLAINAFRRAFISFDVGSGAALSLIMLIVVIVMTLFLVRRISGPLRGE